MIVGTPTTDFEGIEYYPVSSIYQGNQSQTVRVLQPTHPAPGQPFRILFVLPVNSGNDPGSSRWGDGLEELRRLKVPDRFNVTLIAPSFDYEPWYGDNAIDKTRRMESFIVDDLVPFGDGFAHGRIPQRFLVGFSKSGLGALFLILRHPAVFTGAAAWDFPAQLSDIHKSDISSPGALFMNFGTEANFNRYNIPALLSSNGEPFRRHNRLWIGEDNSTFTSEMEKLNSQMNMASVAHTWVEGRTPRAHRWDSGWLPGAISDLMANSALTEPIAGNLPPTRSGALPFGVLHSGSTQTTLVLKTDEAADCRYARVAGKGYSRMTRTFTSQSGISHTAEIGGLRDGGQYSYYLRCRDRVTGSVNSTDYPIRFSVAGYGTGCGNSSSSAFAVSREPLMALLPWESRSPRAEASIGDKTAELTSTLCSW